MRDLDLNILPCFLEVAERGSISKASEVLHLSQPAISLQIKKLEGELGGSLFDRHNRGLVLTPLGKRLRLHARRIMKAVDEIGHILDVPQELAGVLKVGTYTTASSYLLPQALKPFLMEYPKVTLQFNYEETARILDHVKSYELDCAVLSEVPKDPQLDVTPFFKDELIFVCSSEERGVGKPLNPKDLSQFRYLSYPLRYDLCYRMVEQVYGRYLNKADVPIETTSFDTLKNMVLEGIGATFMPAYLVRAELKSGRLKQVPIRGRRLPIQFSFVTKKVDVMMPLVQILRQHVLEFYQV